MRPPPAARSALAALVVGALVIGVSPLLVRVSEVGPIATALWRVALAIPVLALLHRWTRESGQGTARRAARMRGGRERAKPVAMPAAARPTIGPLKWRDTGSGHADAGDVSASGASRRPLDWRDGSLAVALAGVFFAADLMIWHWSLKLTTVANSTFLVNMAPIVVAAAAWAFAGTRPRSGFVAGVGLALAGALLLLRASLDTSAEQARGDAVALCAAFALAAYMVTVGRLRRAWSVTAIMLGSSIASAVVLLPMALATEPVLLPTTPTGWVVVAALALICHAGGQGLIAYSLARIPADYSTLALLLEPVAAAALAWLLFGESMGLAQASGAVAILAGLVVARPPPEPENGNAVRR